MEDTPIGPLLKVVFASILEVFLLCLSGYILAGRGILDKKTQKQINRLNVSLFTPALLFSKVAFFLTPAKLKELWIIPIFFTLITVTSMTVAFVLGTVCRLKKSQRSFAMAAAMFMNSNSLPIALMQSLVVTVPTLKWDDDDNKNIMLGRALTYLVLHSTLGMVLRWSYGVKLLTQADDETRDNAADHSEFNEYSPLLSAQDRHSMRYSQPSMQTVTNNRNNLLHPTPRRRTTFFNSFPNSPNVSFTNLPGYAASAQTSQTASITVTPEGTDNEESGDDESRGPKATLPTHRHGSSSRSTLRKLRHRLVHTWFVFVDFMTVPLWAALASLIVACIPWLQNTLEYRMEPVKGAITSAGKCSIPLTLIVLGAYFHPSPNEGASSRTQEPVSSQNQSVIKKLQNWLASRRIESSEEPVKPGETKTVLIAVASRMILTPLILLPLMAISTTFDFHAVFSDPVFVVANVLLISSPPALTLAQITQAAASGDAFERLISRTIFWSYCIVTPPMTIVYVLVGLVLAKL